MSNNISHAITLSEEIIFIMADVAAEAKLRFLNASAHLYSATVPATSAQLMLQRTRDAGPKSNDGSKSSCKACGTVLIPGWTSHISRVDKQASKVATPEPGSKKHTRGKLSPTPKKCVRVKCLACHRFEDTLLPKSRTSSDSGKAKATSQATSSSDPKSNLDSESSPLDKPNKASKRRERARKHNSGLQAMLEKSKAPAVPSGFGLDLLDLMKQG